MDRRRPAGRRHIWRVWHMPAGRRRSILVAPLLALSREGIDASLRPMPLLSQPSKAPRAKTARAKRGAAQPLVVAIVGNQVEAKLGEVTVTATPEGALWIADAKTLIVSDLHLEK